MFKRITAFLTLFTFLATNIASGVTTNIEITAQSTLPFDVPSEFGTVRRVFLVGEGDKIPEPFVVFIHDVHAEPQTQRNIGKIIAYYHEHLGIETMLLEGATGEADLSSIRALPYAEIKEELAGQLLDRAKLTGAEFEAIVSPKEYRLIGLEEQEIYERHGKAFIENSKFRKQNENIIHDYVKRIAREKEKIFNKDLLEFDRLMGGKYWRGDVLPTLESISALGRRARELGIEFDHLKQIRLFLRMHVLNTLLDIPWMEAGKNDRDRYAKKLSELQREFNAEIFSSEAEELVRAVKEKLFRSDAERLIDRKFRSLLLLQKLVRLEMTPKDWYEYKSAEGSSPIASLNTASAEEFYRLAEARNKILARHAVEQVKRTKRAFLITGGFHGPALEKALEESGISFVSLFPEVSKSPNSKLYADRMAKETEIISPDLAQSWFVPETLKHTLAPQLLSFHPVFQRAFVSQAQKIIQQRGLKLEVGFGVQRTEWNLEEVKKWAPEKLVSHIQWNPETRGWSQGDSKHRRNTLEFLLRYYTGKMREFWKLVENVDGRYPKDVMAAFRSYMGLADGVIRSADSTSEILFQEGITKRRLERTIIRKAKVPAAIQRLFVAALGSPEAAYQELLRLPANERPRDLDRLFKKLEGDEVAAKALLKANQPKSRDEMDRRVGAVVQGLPERLRQLVSKQPEGRAKFTGRLRREGIVTAPDQYLSDRAPRVPSIAIVMAFARELGVSIDRLLDTQSFRIESVSLIRNLRPKSPAERAKYLNRIAELSRVEQEKLTRLHVDTIVRFEKTGDSARRLETFLKLSFMYGVSPGQLVGSVETGDLKPKPAPVRRVFRANGIEVDSGANAANGTSHEFAMATVRLRPDHPLALEKIPGRTITFSPKQLSRFSRIVVDRKRAKSEVSQEKLVLEIEMESRAADRTRIDRIHISAATYHFSSGDGETDDWGEELSPSAQPWKGGPRYPLESFEIFWSDRDLSLTIKQLDPSAKVYFSVGLLEDQSPGPSGAGFGVSNWDEKNVRDWFVKSVPDGQNLVAQDSFSQRAVSILEILNRTESINRKTKALAEHFRQMGVPKPGLHATELINAKHAAEEDSNENITSLFSGDLPQIDPHIAIPVTPNIFLVPREIVVAFQLFSVRKYEMAAIWSSNVSNHDKTLSFLEFVRQEKAVGAMVVQSHIDPEQLTKVIQLIALSTQSTSALWFRENEDLLKDQLEFLQREKVILFPLEETAQFSDNKIRLIVAHEILHTLLHLHVEKMLRSDRRAYLRRIRTPVQHWRRMVDKADFGVYAHLLENDAPVQDVYEEMIVQLMFPAAPAYQGLRPDGTIEFHPEFDNEQVRTDLAGRENSIYEYEPWVRELKQQAVQQANLLVPKFREIIGAQRGKPVAGSGSRLRNWIRGFRSSGFGTAVTGIVGRQISDGGVSSATQRGKPLPQLLPYRKQSRLRNPLQSPFGGLGGIKSHPVMNMANTPNPSRILTNGEVSLNQKVVAPDPDNTIKRVRSVEPTFSRLNGSSIQKAPFNLEGDLIEGSRSLSEDLQFVNKKVTKNKYLAGFGAQADRREANVTGDWAPEIKWLLEEHQFFLEYQYSDEGYVFRGINGGLSEGLISGTFQSADQLKAHGREDAVRVFFLSEQISDAVYGGRFHEGGRDRAILVLRSTVFNKALKARKAAVLGVGVYQTTRNPFLTEPLTLEDVEMIIVHPDTKAYYDSLLETKTVSDAEAILKEKLLTYQKDGTYNKIRALSFPWHVAGPDGGEKEQTALQVSVLSALGIKAAEFVDSELYPTETSGFGAEKVEIEGAVRRLGEMIRRVPISGFSESLKGFSADDIEVISEWFMDQNKELLPPDEILRKLWSHILAMRFYVYEHKGQGAEQRKITEVWIRLLAERWGIEESQVDAFLVWFVRSDIRPWDDQISNALLHGFLKTYLENYAIGQPLRARKGALHKMLPSAIPARQKLVAVIRNIERASGLFSPDFVKGKKIFKVPLKGSPYFLIMYFGTVEDPFRIVFALSDKDIEKRPLAGKFFQITVDIAGDNISIVTMKGVKGKGDVINQLFPKDVGMRPGNALLYSVIVLSELIGFEHLLGIRGEHHTTAEHGRPLDYSTLHQALGLRGKFEGGRFKDMASLLGRHHRQWLNDDVATERVHDVQESSLDLIMRAQEETSIVMRSGVRLTQSVFFTSKGFREQEIEQLDVENAIRIAQFTVAKNFPANYGIDLDKADEAAAEILKKPYIQTGINELVNDALRSSDRQPVQIAIDRVWSRNAEKADDPSMLKVVIVQSVGTKHYWEKLRAIGKAVYKEGWSYLHDLERRRGENTLLNGNEGLDFFADLITKHEDIALLRFVREGVNFQTELYIKISAGFGAAVGWEDFLRGRDSRASLATYNVLELGDRVSYINLAGLGKSEEQFVAKLLNRGPLFDPEEIVRRGIGVVINRDGNQDVIELLSVPGFSPELGDAVNPDAMAKFSRHITIPRSEVGKGNTFLGKLSMQRGKSQLLIGEKVRVRSIALRKLLPPGLKSILLDELPTWLDGTVIYYQFGGYQIAYRIPIHTTSVFSQGHAMPLSKDMVSRLIDKGNLIRKVKVRKGPTGFGAASIVISDAEAAIRDGEITAEAILNLARSEIASPAPRARNDGRVRIHLIFSEMESWEHAAEFIEAAFGEKAQEIFPLVSIHTAETIRARAKLSVSAKPERLKRAVLDYLTTQAHGQLVVIENMETAGKGEFSARAENVRRLIIESKSGALHPNLLVKAELLSRWNGAEHIDELVERGLKRLDENRWLDIETDRVSGEIFAQIERARSFDIAA